MSILVVDDSPEDRTAIGHYLVEACREHRISLRMHESQKGEEGLAAFISESPHCILLDYRLPDMDGLEFLARLKDGAAEIPVPVVMLTGSSDKALPTAALQAGAHEYLPKRFMGPEMLLRAVRSAQDRFNLLTERFRAEAALATSEAMLRLSQQAAGMASFEQDFGSDEIRWAAGSQTLLGFLPTQATMAMGEWRSVRDPGDAARAEVQQTAAFARHATSANYEFRIRRPDNGEIRHIELNLSIVYDRSGQPMRANAAVLDFTERQAREEALRITAARLRMTQEAGQIGTWDWREGTDDMHWSPENFALHGMAPSTRLVGYRDWLATIHLDDRERAGAALKDAMAAQHEFEIEYRVVLADGSIRWLGGRGMAISDGDGRPGRVLGVSHDITLHRGMTAQLARMNDDLERRVRERTASLVDESSRRLEAETLLHQAQKMEAIGQLTGGIAHDFNNILQVVIGNIELVQRQLEPSQALDAEQAERAKMRAMRSMDRALKASKSAAQLTHRLLAFGRRQLLVQTELDVNQLVAGMSDMFRRTLGETIKVETALADGLWPTFADANQLEAAILNLVVNAGQAMPLGGWLTIATKNVDLNETDTTHVSDIAPGRYVLLSVTDTGSGIPKDTLEHVFEPFFTTKEVGKGTGLGLAMVHGFVKQSGGHVHIRSEVGQGTTVEIYLRHSLTTAADGAGMTPSPLRDTREMPALPLARDGETILIVEDEEDVRLYVREALEDLRYRVLTAVDAAAAIALLEASHGRGVSMLFTDVVLPGGMSGPGLADQVGERWPTLAVLFTTGYSQEAIARAGKLAAQVRFLGKPYSFEALARKIRETLDIAWDPASK